MKKLFYALSVLFLFILGGCAMLQQMIRINNPTVTFKNFHLDNITSNEVEGTVNISISNSNAFTIPLSQIETDVLLDNSPFTTLANTVSRTIGAYSNETIGFRVKIPFSSIPNIINVVKSNSDKIKLGFNSKLYFQQPLSMTIPINFNVNIPKPKLPKIKFSSVKIGSISFSNVTININFDIDNPNNFRISGTKIWGKLNISGNTIANIDENIFVDKNSKKNFPVTINISTAALGLSLIDQLKRNNASYSFSGSIRLPFGTYLINF